ncbi:YfiT family bacillithiol transferase [Halalkalibaculum sp. DA384]|uniref:YfiT family bacillithiol transferase n=1 Tax=Halalkalibaculum sp. DA384 TaxID=3373606 RepID=UPI003755062B
MEQNLRYPIGPEQSPASYGEANIPERIDEIEHLPKQLTRTLHPLTRPQLETPYRPGGWTVRQVIHHIADSHMNGFIRTKWALTEDLPTIKPYEQEKWAALSDYQAPVSTSLDLITSLHSRWEIILHRLSKQQMFIQYIHPESGKQSLWQHIFHYAWHGRHHLAHITQLIERKNWH